MSCYRIGTVNDFPLGWWLTGFQLYQIEERVALRKQGLNEKTASSVLLKLFISGNERFRTTNAPLAHEQNYILKCKQTYNQ